MINNHGFGVPVTVRSFGFLPSRLPFSDNNVPREAMMLRSFATHPSFYGNNVSNDSRVIAAEVVGRLLHNFSVFESPHFHGRISVRALKDVISGRTPGVSAENVELAKMIFVMPGLLNQLEGRSHFDPAGGERFDGGIDKRTLELLDTHYAPFLEMRREYYKSIKF